MVIKKDLVYNYMRFVNRDMNIVNYIYIDSLKRNFDLPKLRDWS